MVELVNILDEKSTASVSKSESTAKVPFKLFFGHMHTYIICLVLSAHCPGIKGHMCSYRRSKFQLSAAWSLLLCTPRLPHVGTNTDHITPARASACRVK